MKVLIVEDEKAAVRNLRALLNDVAPQYEIVDATDSIFDTVEWLALHPMPDLIFMDIHLADGSAFEIFERKTISCPVIFTTAYDEYSLKAFKVNSIDYLLKPIGERDIRRALNKLELLRNSSGQQNDDLMRFVKTMSRQERYMTHFLVPSKGNKLLPLSVDSVYYFCIVDGTVKAVAKDGEQYTIPYTLDELSDTIDPDRFFRVNRQYLISREAIHDIDLWFHSRLLVNLKAPVAEKILVSRARVGEFKTWFAGNARSIM